MKNKKSAGKPPSSSKTTQPQKSQAKIPADKNVFRLSVLLFVVCIALYANTCYNDYCLDDTMVVTENSSTQKGFAGISEHLGQDLLFGYKHTRSKTTAGGRWRPLSMISYSVEIGLWGKNKPGYSHFVNMLLYAAIVVSLFLLLFRHIFKEVWISFFAALLFAIHPIHTEVVANIKSRDELLCLLFLLLSIHRLWKFVATGKNSSLIVSLVFYFLSLTAKENSFTFLLGIPIMLYYFTKLERRQIISYTAGYGAIAILFLLIRSAIVPMGGLAPDPEVINNAFLYAKGFEALFTKLYVLLLDLKLLLIPYPLSYDYSYNQIPYKTLSDPWVLGALVIYISMIIYGIIGVKKKNIFSFCIWMYLLTLSISSNLFIEIGTLFGERLLFMPSIFFCMVLALLGKAIVSSVTTKPGNIRIAILAILILPVFLASAYVTVNRNTEWKDERTLTLADISKSPNSARANNGAGGSCLFYSFDSTLSKSSKDSLLDASVIYLKKSIEIFPGYNDALLNLGVAYAQKDSMEKSEEYWNMVRTKSPNHPKLKIFDNILANKYLKAGLDCANKSKLDSSLIYLNKALDYSSRSDSLKLSCLYNIGALYFTTGNYEKAHEAFGKTIEINPGYMNAMTGYEESGRLIKK